MGRVLASILRANSDDCTNLPRAFADIEVIAKVSDVGGAVGGCCRWRVEADTGADGGMGRRSGPWHGAVVVVVDAALAAVTVMTCAAASVPGAGSEAGDANGPQR